MYLARRLLLYTADTVFSPVHHYTVHRLFFSSSPCFYRHRVSRTPTIVTSGLIRIGYDATLYAADVP